MLNWIVAAVVTIVSPLITYRVLPRRWTRRATWMIVLLGFAFSSVVIGVYSRDAERKLRQLRLPAVVATTTTSRRHR